MKISAHLEFDTFAEATKVFQHMELLDAKGDVKPSGHAEVPKTNGAHPSSASSAATASTPALSPDSASTASASSAQSEITLDELKSAMRAYIAKAGGRTAGTGRQIMLHHGVESGNPNHAKPEQFAVLKRAFETAGPEMPLGEAA